MDDVLFLGLAIGVVEYVEERYGRVAAWTAAAVMIALPFALIVGTVCWFLC